MARRGQTYGTRADDPNDGKLSNKPTGGVGLLFMAFNVDIANQFEFTQSVWANNPGFPAIPQGAQAPGIDLVIGQTKGEAERPSIEAPLAWDADRSNPANFKSVDAPKPEVTARGGEYFFMPSLSFLHSLATATQTEIS